MTVPSTSFFSRPGWLKYWVDYETEPSDALAVEKTLADREVGSGSTAPGSCGCVPGHGVPGCDLHGPTGPSKIW